MIKQKVKIRMCFQNRNPHQATRAKYRHLHMEHLIYPLMEANKIGLKLKIKISRNFHK